ncbi:hypothetical protein EDB87DRAFT_1678827 [Lactarius vividus]|nr:hypothetical protein EDB87DRAFT_1678827 [Lactarius vividus]
MIQALDSSTTTHPGETTSTFLTPQSWFHLAAAVLAATIRGKLCSPSKAISGTHTINTNDMFEIHKDLNHPLTEGAALRFMALQLAESFDTLHNNLFCTNLEKFYDDLFTIQINTISKVVEKEAKVNFDPTTICEDTYNHFLNNEAFMASVKEEVKQNIFNQLNKEALKDLNTWCKIYCEEFKDIMQQYIVVNKFGMDPIFIKLDIKGKKQAKSTTLELEKATEDIEHIMCVNCQAQIDLMQITAYKQVEFTRLQAEAIKGLDEEIEALKLTYKVEHEQYVRKHHDTTRELIKEWKVHHTNLRKLDFLHCKAKNLGYSLVANDTDAFKPNLDPMEAALDWLPTSCASSRAHMRSNSPIASQETSRTCPVTPPRLKTNMLIPDPNVTPTPVCVKQVHMDKSNPLWEPDTNQTTFLPLPLPPIQLLEDYSLPPSSIPSPMEEDEPIDSLRQQLEANNRGIEAFVTLPL